MGAAAAGRSRGRIALAVPAVIALGLALRFGLSGYIADASGGVLYALLVYLAIAFIAPRLPAIRVAVIALGVSIGIELLQLTAIPLRLAEAVPPAALALGTSFALADLPPYVVGALAGVLLDRFLASGRSAGRR